MVITDDCSFIIDDYLLLLMTALLLLMIIWWLLLLLMIIFDDYYWWLLLMIIIDDYWLLLIIIMVFIFYGNKINCNSSIYKVIRSVSKFLLLFYDNISQVQKGTEKHNQYIVFFFKIRFCQL